MSKRKAMELDDFLRLSFLAPERTTVDVSVQTPPLRSIQIRDWLQRVTPLTSLASCPYHVPLFHEHGCIKYGWRTCQRNYELDTPSCVRHHSYYACQIGSLSELVAHKIRQWILQGNLHFLWNAMSKLPIELFDRYPLSLCLANFSKASLR